MKMCIHVWNISSLSDLAYWPAADEHDSSLQRTILKDQQQIPNNFA
jgi:hypothetical protein